MSKLICGCGYLGTRVARRWRSAGHPVSAITRTAQRAGELSSLELRPIIADVTKPYVIPDEVLPIDTVLFALGFDHAANQTLSEVYLEGLANTLFALPAQVKRIIYISSTGVFGESDGEWVDEGTPCRPTRAAGQACLAAEEALAASPFGSRAIILRLAGLYGPGRIPKMGAVQRGEPIAVAETGYLNLIHVEDAADIVLAVERLVEPPRTIVVSDGHPVVRGEFYRELSRRMSAPPPRFAQLDGDSLRPGRSAGDKRVDNRRQREILPGPLRFPTYREGLEAVVAFEDRSFNPQPEKPAEQRAAGSAGEDRHTK